MNIPRAQFLPRNQPLILPNSSRHIVPSRPASRSRTWNEAVVKVLFVIGILTVFGALYLGVRFGILSGEFIKR